MAEESGRNKVNIGASSLILIFIVLCLAVFGLLSLSNARGDMALAERNVQAVTGYYEADNKGQQWLREIDRILMEEMAASGDSGQCSLNIKDRLGDIYDRERGIIATDIPMDRGQSLHIELMLVCGKYRYEVKSWYVYNSEEYEIDDSMPVWDGGVPAQG
ncbi:MAG: hypothetical protein LIP16_09000 [Clostridium sp.]|nr:hypothetical protein [Clostridium sp.]